MKYQLTTLANFDGRTSAPRLKKLRWLTPLLVAFGVAVALSGQASAYSNSRLMDDQVFDNVGSLNAAQVADFLAARTGPFTKLSGPSPCLSGHSNINFHWDNVKWHYGSDADWNTAWGPAQIAASDIIYKAAQMWGINPQVLIATLQKEQSLITGTSCDGWRYNSAMGYGCPDSGGCNPKYAGFSKQVLWGAWQLKFNKERSYGNTTWDGDDVITYVGYMTQGTRKRCGTCTANYYDGYATIDGQTFYLENGTTASLYTYTPHLGQSFPGIFQGWFGPTILPTHAWNFAGQTSTKDLNGIIVGQTATLSVSAVNAGNTTWTNSGANPVRLGASQPRDRKSLFATSGWIAPTRPANLDQASVAPGQTGTFTFTIQAPAAPGDYKEYFNLLAEGVTWMNDPGVYFTIRVAPITYTWSLAGQAAYSDSGKTTGIDLAAFSPGQSGWLVLKAKNTGNVIWSNSGANPIRVGTEANKDRRSLFNTGGWLAPHRPSNMVESSVAPGAIGTFEFPITAPANGGTYFERFNVLAEGITWMNDLGLYYYIKVNSGYSWTLTSQYAYADSSKTAGANLAALSPGQTVFIGLTAKNTGTATWFNSGPYPMDLATSRPIDRISKFQAVGWLAPQRPARMKEAFVASGQTATFEFNYTAPAQVGTYFEYFNPVAEAITHLNDIGMYFYTVVQ